MKEIKVGISIPSLKPNRNDACPFGSDKKFKHYCIELYNERLRWDALEDALREKVGEY